MFSIGSYLTKRCVVFGCGNPLFGDDGFGPCVIEHLAENYDLPEEVVCVDIGTAIRDLLFDMLLSPQKPEQVVIVDAMDLDGGVPGRIYEIDVDRIHPDKIADFSLHQFPTTNMLKEIRDNTAVAVRVLVVQTAPLPQEIRPGLSPAVAAAVPEMCRCIMGIVAPASLVQPSESGGSQ